MKKYYLPILILFCLILTACTSRETHSAKTLNEFETICTNLGFTVNDNLSRYADDEITGSKVAKYDNEEIEMVIYDNAKSAKKVQDGHIDSFMKIRNTLVTVDEKKGKNFHTFKMVANGYYWVSTSVDNTLIFTKVPIDYKEKIDTILNELGY